MDPFSNVVTFKPWLDPEYLSQVSSYAKMGSGTAAK